MKPPGDRLPFGTPPAALHALAFAAARRLKAVVSAHAQCNATAAGAIALGSAAADSVAITAASPPEHHCQLRIVAQQQRIIVLRSSVIVYRSATLRLCGVVNV